MFPFRAGFPGKPRILGTRSGSMDSPSGLAPQEGRSQGTLAGAAVPCSTVSLLEGPITTLGGFPCLALKPFHVSLEAMGAPLQGGLTHGGQGMDQVVRHVAHRPGWVCSQSGLERG